MFLSSAIILLAIAVVLLAAAILFREEIRGFVRNVAVMAVVAVPLYLLWSWSGIAPELLGSPTGIFGVALVAGIVTKAVDHAGRQEKEQRAARSQAVSSDEQLVALKRDWEHGQLADEDYHRLVTETRVRSDS